MKENICQKCGITGIKIHTKEFWTIGWCRPCYELQPNRIAHKKQYSKEYRTRQDVRDHIKTWRREYDKGKGKIVAQRYRKTFGGIVTYLRVKHRTSLSEADCSNNTALENGWPDRTEGSTMIEIKRGKDNITPAQILRHRWIEQVFNAPVKIYWYPRVVGYPELLIFDNYREFFKYLEEYRGEI